jgi:3-oxoacyl-[acyl-carrier-protein] synthase-1
MKPEVVITGIAMITPVGLRMDQTCAAVRARIARFEELSWRDKAYAPIVMSAVPDDCLPELSVEHETDPLLTVRAKRIIRFADFIAEELREAEIQGKIPFLLGLPQANEEKPVEADKILQYAANRMEIDIDPILSEAIPRGRASGLMAIHHACSLIKSEQADYVLVGGCDTYKDIEVLGFLNVANRLKSETGLDGFIPGEGAGFLLLASENIAKRHQRNIYGKIAATSIYP